MATRIPKAAPTNPRNLAAIRSQGYRHAESSCREIRCCLQSQSAASHTARQRRSQARACHHHQARPSRSRDSSPSSPADPADIFGCMKGTFRIIRRCRRTMSRITWATAMSRVLLDTHVWLWLAEDKPISKRSATRKLILEASSRNALFLKSSNLPLGDRPQSLAREARTSTPSSPLDAAQAVRSHRYPDPLPSRPINRLQLRRTAFWISWRPGRPHHRRLRPRHRLHTPDTRQDSPATGPQGTFQKTVAT